MSVEIRRSKLPDEVMNDKIDAVARALDRCAQERGHRIPAVLMRHLAVAALEAALR